MIENGFDAFIPDPFKAADCYEKAHNNKNTDATFNLGLLYLNSERFGVESNEALKLINEAALKGNTKAQEHLINIGYVNSRSEFVHANLQVSESDSELEEEEEEDEIRKSEFGNL